MQPLGGLISVSVVASAPQLDAGRGGRRLGLDRDRPHCIFVPAAGLEGNARLRPCPRCCFRCCGRGSTRMSDLPGHFQLPCARPTPSYQQARWLSRGCALTATHFPLDGMRDPMQARPEKRVGPVAPIGSPPHHAHKNSRSFGREAQSGFPSRPRVKITSSNANKPKPSASPQYIASTPELVISAAPGR